MTRFQVTVRLLDVIDHDRRPFSKKHHEAETSQKVVGVGTSSGAKTPPLLLFA